MASGRHLLGQGDAAWQPPVLAFGWGFVIWGTAMYLWSGVLYLIQVGMVARSMPRPGSGGTGVLTP